MTQLHELAGMQNMSIKPRVFDCTVRFMVVAILILAGCTRAHYRRQADREVSYTIAGTSADPRWCLPGINLRMDPRSRYFEPFDQDCPPIPEDDPASARYMECVDGKKGWKHHMDKPPGEAKD